MSPDFSAAAAVSVPHRPVTSLVRTRIEIDPARVLRWHFLFVLLLTLAHLAVSWVHLETGRDHLMGLTSRLQFFTEASIPAFFSAVMLVFAAAIAAVLSRVEGGRRAREGRA